MALQAQAEQEDARAQLKAIQELFARSNPLERLRAEESWLTALQAQAGGSLDAELPGAHDAQRVNTVFAGGRSEEQTTAHCARVCPRRCSSCGGKQGN